MISGRAKRLFVVLVAFLIPGLAAAGDRWEFEVLLDDKEVGFHNFEVTTTDGGRRLDTEASFDVKFLFVTAFRYRHQNTEIWRDGCLSSISAFTNNNGDRLAVNGGAAGDGFEVESQRGSESLSGCVQTFAYWNPEILAADRLLNSQTGDYEDIEVAYAGSESVEVGDSLVDADRYTLTASGGDISLWYSQDDQRWLALEAPAKGGRTIRYRPLSVPTADDRSRVLARGD